MDELQRQLRAFSQAYDQKGKAIVERIQQLMDGGMTVTQAVQQAFQEYDVADWLDANVSQSIVSTAQDALGAELAGALSSAELLKALSIPWDGSGMTLSQKLHGAETDMRQTVVDALQQQFRRNSTVRKTAQALYDGYGYGHVTGTQELPRYLDELTRWTRRSQENLTPEERKAVQKAVRKVKAQADGLVDDRVTYNHFRTALNELMEKVEYGSEKAAQKALKTAVEEKSRYVAERLARTEAARARYDAFIARYGEDEDVVAYQWKLGSRHPAEDICDMYAEADLYGLGKGIFPKDAAPVNPAHPHCLCHYAPVYRSELEGKKRSNNVEENGRAWLEKQPLHIRQAILGVKGEQEWKAGRVGWMEKARNLNLQIGEYYGLKSRLRRFMNTITRRPSSSVVLEDLPKIKETLSMEENALKTNPNFYSDKKGAEYYRFNCQKCVPVFELRMRGYDVQAKWFDESNSNSNEKWLVEHPFSAFLSANIKTISSGASAYDELSKALQGYGAGARIEIAILNEETFKGHVIVGCNDYNNIKFLDVQTGKSFSFAGLNDNINIEYARIDMLKINTEILSDICDWR